MTSGVRWTNERFRCFSPLDKPFITVHVRFELVVTGARVPSGTGCIGPIFSTFFEGGRWCNRSGDAA